jgi:hypothetical protein
VLKHPPPGLVPLRLAERARVEACPDGGRVSGDLRRLHRVNPSAPGQRAEAAPEVARGRSGEPSCCRRVLDGAGDVPLREGSAGAGREDEVVVAATAACEVGLQQVGEGVLDGGKSGTSRSLAFVLSGTRRAGRSWRAGRSCLRTRSSPSTKSTSAQVSPRTSETRRPEYASTVRTGR